MKKIQERQILKQNQIYHQMDKKYDRILKSYLHQNQALKIKLQYCLEILNKINFQSLNNSQIKQNQTFQRISPKLISKRILKEQLKIIQSHFNKFPNKQCKIQHFLLILIQVIKFDFQQTFKYMIGLVQMFNQLQNRQTNLISYQIFQTYIIGQITSLKEQEQNTQFQVNFEEKKKQDYLLHDNGIKKIYFSKDLQIYFVLDQSSDMIKIYNHEMRSISKYMPSKLKHNNQIPKIKYFDFNQLGTKIGLILQDNTFQLIDIVSFMNKPRQKFENNIFEFKLFQLPQQMFHLEFIQMTNKWITISNQNKIYLLNPEMSKQSPIEQFIKEIKIFSDPKFQMKITNIVQLVPLSSIAIIAGNQIFFYNQNLNQKKINNYKHGSNIKNVKFSEERNQLFIQGDQKNLVILTIQRNFANYKYSQYSLDFIFNNFQIFPQFQTILVTDQHHNVYLYDIKNHFCYQTKSYFHIAKKSNKRIQILKTSKFEFLIYQSYIISITQQKVSIQKQFDYAIDQNIFFDKLKQEMYMSVNNQIINFNILTGQIRKIYNSDHYNMQKFHKFLLNEKFKILILDSEMNLFYLRKKKEIEKFRKFQISEIKALQYDKFGKKVYVIGKNQIFQCQTQHQQFNIQRHIILQNFSQFLFTNFNSDNQTIFLATYDQTFYLIKIKDFSVDKKIQIKFPKDNKILQEKRFLQVFYSYNLQAIFLLSNNNQLIIFSIIDTENQIYINLQECIINRNIDQGFKFIRMMVSEYKNRDINNNKQNSYTNISLSNNEGHFLQIDLTQIVNKHMKNIQAKKINQQYKQVSAKYINNNKYILSNQCIYTEAVLLNTHNKINLCRKNYAFYKRHNKQIIIIKNIFIEKNLTLTVAKDGQIKLYQKAKSICTISLPNLAIQQSNTNQIQSFKLVKTTKELLNIIKKYENYLNNKTSPKQLLNKAKKHKLKQDQLKKINYDQPIPIDIERKTIEQIVNQQMFYETDKWKNQGQFSLISKTQSFLKSINKKPNIQQELFKNNPHPWRVNKNFKQIFSNAPSKNKYTKLIPNDLLHLRKSLDMIPKKTKLINPEQIQINILPQLSSYEFEVPNRVKKSNINQNEQSQTFDQKKDGFQSCYFVKSQKKIKKSNINDFDQIDKQFYKKNMNFVKKFIPKKDKSKEDKNSKSLFFNKDKVNQSYNENIQKNIKQNPISNIIALFERHNKQFSGNKFGRQIRITKEIKDLRNKSFNNRY